MGGDGGVFAVNRKFFAACRNTSKDGQSDATENEERQIKLNKRFIKCRTCAITNEELVEPIVACRLGYLYTKENLLTALLNKTLHSNFSHVKGLKHVKEVILTPNSEYSSDSSGCSGGVAGDGGIGKEDSELSSRYMCPVTQLPLNGLYSFVLIWTTGYILSDKAIREIGEEGLQLEYGPFSTADDDVVRLIPPEEELNTRRATLQAQAEVAKKKAKEEKKRARAGDGASSAVSGTTERPRKLKKEEKKGSGSGGGGNLTVACKVVEAARNNVAASKEKSDLYDKLFLEEKEEKRTKTGSEMFFSVAGIRYTL